MTTRRTNGVNWEALHKELQAQRVDTKAEMGAMEHRLSEQVTALSLRFEAFTQETRDSRHGTAVLLAQLTGDMKATKEQCESCPIEELQIDMTQMKIDSARGDKRVGIVGSILTFLGALAAAIYGASK